MTSQMMPQSGQGRRGRGGGVKGRRRQVKSASALFGWRRGNGGRGDTASGSGRSSGRGREEARGGDPRQGQQQEENAHRRARRVRGVENAGDDKRKKNEKTMNTRESMGETNELKQRREVLMLSAVTPTAVFPLVLGSIFHFGGEKPTLGVQPTGTLSLCPRETHNCVSTAETDASEYSATPWRPRAGSTRAEALAELVETIQTSSPSNFTPTVVENNEENYVRAEFESPTFGFVDDVEFFFRGEKSADESIVEFRSASRLGDSDFGVNTLRMQTLFDGLRNKGWTNA